MSDELERGEEELLERSRSGDRKAFEALVAPLRERIFRYLVTMFGDEAQAEDLAQESLRIAMERVAGFRADCKFSTWLFQIAVNLGRRHLRDLSRHAATASETRLERGEARGRARREVLSTILRRELADGLAIAIDQLPPTMREAFVLRAVEGIDYEEMAAVTGATAKALRVRVHRARQLLRELLGPWVDTGWGRGG